MEAGEGAHEQENEGGRTIPSPDVHCLNREGVPGSGSFLSVTEPLPELEGAPEPEEIP
jgi:hypothetical protein